VGFSHPYDNSIPIAGERLKNISFFGDKKVKSRIAIAIPGESMISGNRII
jgi:hypothetical protein